MITTFIYSGRITKSVCCDQLGYSSRAYNLYTMEKIILYISDKEGNNYYEEINASPIILKHIKSTLIIENNIKNYNIEEYKYI